MTGLTYVFKKNIKLNEYHFFQDDKDFIIPKDKSFMTNKDLWKDWTSKSNLATSYTKYNITNSISAENVFFYLLLIWKLAEGKKLYASGLHATKEITIAINSKPNMTKWIYNLEHELSAPNTVQRNDIGYIPLDNTGVFEVKNFQNLADIIKCSSDESSLNNFYICNNATYLIDSLNSETPSLNKVLDNQDIFIALLIGEDWGNYNYILMKSKYEITDQLDKTIDLLRYLSKQYIKEIQKISSSREMDSLIDRLAQSVASKAL